MTGLACIHPFFYYIEKYDKELSAVHQQHKNCYTSVLKLQKDYDKKLENIVTKLNETEVPQQKQQQHIDVLENKLQQQQQQQQNLLYYREK